MRNTFRIPASVIGSPRVGPRITTKHSAVRHPAEWQRPTDDHVVTSEAVELVIAAIAELPPTQRLVITLRDVDCWSAQEVCHILDLSGANQRVLLHRARSKVRARLASYFEGGDDG